MNEERVICCFAQCGETIDQETFGDQFPLCPHHRRCVETCIRLEEIGVTMPLSLPMDRDWLDAKYFAILLGFSDDGRELLPKIVGDTPLLRVVTSTLGLLYAALLFLRPDKIAPEIPGALSSLAHCLV